MKRNQQLPQSSLPCPQLPEMGYLRWEFLRWEHEEGGTLQLICD